MRVLHRVALAASLAVPLTFASAPGAAARPMMCPMIYAPVCAIKHGIRKTYSNACVAHAAHAHVLYRGRCRFHRG